MNPALSLPLNLAVVGAGPVGLALALLAAESLPRARITLWDARPLGHDVSGDPRTLALSLGSVQLLQRLQAWPMSLVQAIEAVHVSQHTPAWGRLGEAEVTLSAQQEGVPMLGAVLRYGQLTAELQRRWLQLSAQAPERLVSRFGTPVQSLKNLSDRVEIDADVVEEADLAVVAEGGVFAQRDSSHSVLTRGAPARPFTRDYRQTAWVGQVRLRDPHRGVAWERFTTDGPVALLPLPTSGTAETPPGHPAALVWCVATDNDPVAPLSDTQRVHLLNTLVHPRVGPVSSLSPLKSFALGLQAHRTLTEGRTVRIGNAAQTLHPVAGQGLNLGLRDAYALVQGLREHEVTQALRRLEWQRGPDRWALLATTDFLARSFAWQLPGSGTLRGLGLAALQALGPVKSALARQMMFGRR